MLVLESPTDFDPTVYHLPAPIEVRHTLTRRGEEPVDGFERRVLRSVELLLQSDRQVHAITYYLAEPDLNAVRHRILLTLAPVLRADGRMTLLSRGHLLEQLVRCLDLLRAQVGPDVRLRGHWVRA